MRKTELIRKIDNILYRKTCEEAQKYATTTGKIKDTKNSFDSELPHDISFDLWDLEIPTIEIIDICFELYEDMPCYTYLMYLAMEYKSFSDNEKIYTLQKISQYLIDGNLIFTTPIEYSLWCDYFEDPEVVAYTWNNLLEICNYNDNVLKSLLEVSDPVPYNLKQKLYNFLIKDEKWHYQVFKSLLFSTYDYFGSINDEGAVSVFRRLNIDETSDEVIYFMKKLEISQDNNK